MDSLRFFSAGYFLSNTCALLEVRRIKTETRFAQDHTIFMALENIVKLWTQDCVNYNVALITCMTARSMCINAQTVLLQHK